MTGVFVRISTRLWGGGLLAAVLVGGLFGSGTASAMAGADEVTGGAYPFVAKVSVGDARACTGALVDARWIVTAKACFADGAVAVTAGAPTLPTTVVVGRSDLTAITGHRLAVLSVLPHPDRNLALAELSAPVPDVRPVALGGGAPQVGDRLRVAGYGRTADEWVPNRLHTAAFDVTSVTSTSFEIDGVTEAAAVCKGDAGGPAFRELDGRVELVGINDTSWQKGCLGVTSTRDGAQEARTDDLADWIRAGIAVQPSALREPVTGEFNRDAYTDLIAADQAGILWLHPGTPTRNVWGPRVRIGAGWAGYREFTIGRFNRDAFDDLVTIESATGRLWLYPGTAAGGAFGARVEIGSGWTDFRDLSVGRLNRDQYDDLLTVQSSTQKLFLYTGTAAGGRLNAGVQVGAGWGCCKQLTVGRFDGDDYDDLVTVNSTGSLLIYRGTAAGNTFAAGVDAGAGAAWNAGSYLARGRFDDTGLDGLLAVDASTGQTWLHPRTAAAGWGTRIQPGGRVWAPRPNELSKLVTGEFNRDAHTDLIGVDTAGILWLHRGTPARTFGPRVQIGAGWTGYRDLVVGRFNRDAFDDLVTIESATGKLWLYPGTAAGGAFGARVEIGSGWTDFRDLSVGRLNRDQYDDLLTVQDSTQKLFLYTGTAAGGRLNAGVQVGAGWGCCKQLTVGRFDGDDYDDLLTVQSTGTLLIYRGTTAGDTFAAGVAAGATSGWQTRTELTAVRFGTDTGTALLSRDATGTLVLNPARANGSVDWADPIRFGPRD